MRRDQTQETAGGDVARLGGGQYSEGPELHDPQLLMAQVTVNYERRNERLADRRQ